MRYLYIQRRERENKSQSERQTGDRGVSQILKHKDTEIDGERHRCPHKNTEKHRDVERQW